MARVRTAITLLATALAALAAAPAAQATDATCADLQAKINAEPPGGTVTLAQGETCALVGILSWSGKALTLEGAGTGATLTRDGAFPGNSILDITDGGASVVRNLTFRDSEPQQGNPGAINVTGTTTPTFDRVRLFDNATQGFGAGGAIHVTSTSPAGAVTILDSSFGDGTVANRNFARTGGAVSVTAQNGVAVEVRRSTFAGNRATEQGGALLVSGQSGHVTLEGNTFTGNEVVAPSGSFIGGGALRLSTTGPGVTLTGNSFTANKVVAPATTNFAAGAGADIGSGSVQGAPATSSGNTFSGNQITSANANITVSGGGLNVFNLRLTSRGDRFAGNSLPAAGTGEAEGAGLSLRVCPAPDVPASRIENGIIAGNTAAGTAEGAGVYVGCSAGPVALTVANSTISGNAAGGDTAGIWGGSADTLTVVNSVIAGNTGALDIAGFDAGRTITFSDVCAGGVAHAGAGNICADPKLVAPATGDVQQQPSSPLRDAGSNAGVPLDLTTDAFGDARITDGDGNGTATVDMGADESPAVAPSGPGPAGPATGPTGPSGPVGKPGPGPGTTPRDRVRPVIAVSVTNRRFKVGGTGATFAAVRPRTGTRIRFRLSEAASTVVRIEARTTGRRVGRACRARTRANARRRPCIRYVLKGQRRQALRAGLRSIAFNGRVKRRALPAGAYRATLVATDAARNRSAQRAVAFTIVRG